MLGSMDFNISNDVFLLRHMHVHIDSHYFLYRAEAGGQEPFYDVVYLVEAYGQGEFPPS